MAPNYPHFLVFIPLCKSFSLSVGRTCVLLLINRTCQRWWKVTSVIALQKTVTLILLADFLYGLSGFDEVSNLMERPMCQRTEDSFSSTAQGLRPSVQKTTRCWMLLTMMWTWKKFLPHSNPRWEPSPALANTWLQSCERPWSRGLSEAIPDSWPRENTTS